MKKTGRLIAFVAAAGLSFSLIPLSEQAAYAEPQSAELTQPSANPVTFPGTAPGEPNVVVAGTQGTLSNNALSLTLDVSNGLAVSRVDNKLTSEQVPFSTDQLFAFTYGGTKYDLSNFTAGTLQKVDITPAEQDTGSFADSYSGKALKVEFNAKDALPEALRNLHVSYRAELLSGSNYVRHVLTMRNGGDAPLDITDVYMVSSATVTGSVEGRDDGSPIVLGADGAESAWVGGENPMAKVSVTNGVAISRLPRANDLVEGKPWEIATTIGVAPGGGQLRRSFSYYVERERARARRTFLHFQSWFDLKPGGAKLTIDHEQMLAAERLFFSQMTARGAAVDSYWVDDGWDYLRDPRQANESGLNVWSFDPVEFANGFAEDLAVMKEQGAKLSVWMSPFGGYGTSSGRRAQIGNSKLSDTDSANNPWTSSNKVMRLSDPVYFNYFRDRVFAMIDSGVLGFKFDGIAQGNLFITGANDNLVADYEALFDLMQQMRAHEKDVWINATVGTWGSPYWLWYADSIYRDGNDAGQAGQGNSQEKYVTYRDDMVHQNMIVENPLMPLNSVMNHGVILSDRTDGQIPNQPHDFSSESVRTAFANDLKNFFSMGIGLQELYLRSTFFDPAVIGEENANWAWDKIALNARWARENVELLTDTHWIGGDPASGEVYGTAAWHNPSSSKSDARAMIAVRNPTAAPAFIAVNAAQALEVPEGQARRFRFVERDGAAEPWVSSEDAPYYIELDPFEVLLFEGVPTDDEPTASQEPEVDPCYTAIARTDWEASADSAQLTGNEQDPARNMIDGNPATIWHTQWTPTQTPYPHWLQVDMGRVNEVCRLSYLPRQNATVTNGDIKGYKLEVSTDGQAWETVVEAAEFSSDKTEKFIEIPQDKRSFRYFKLTATSSHNGSHFAGGAEINAYGVQGVSEWLDRENWQCTASDFEATGEQDGNSGHPEHACDGVIGTQWHSQYNPSVAPMPHWIQVDTGTMAEVSALRYTPRQDVYPANGIVANYSVQYSTDGQQWHDAAHGALTDASRAVIEFPDVVRARYVRFNALSAQNGQQFAGAAEIDVRGQYVQLTPEAPVFTDEDGSENDTYTIPEVEGVRYLINGNAVDPGVHSLPAGQDTVQITAAAADGWQLAEGEWMWAHTFSAGSAQAEPTVTAVPGAMSNVTPGASDPANCDTKPSVQLTLVDGVVYTVKVGDKVLTPDVNGRVEYGYGETVTVTAQARDGFALPQGEQMKWEWTAPTRAELQCGSEEPGSGGVGPGTEQPGAGTSTEKPGAEKPVQPGIEHPAQSGSVTPGIPGKGADISGEGNIESVPVLSRTGVHAGAVLPVAIALAMAGAAVLAMRRRFIA